MHVTTVEDQFSEKKPSEFLWKVIGYLYAVLVVAAGLSITLFYTVIGKEMPMYFEATAVQTMFVSAIAVLITFFVYIHKMKDRKFPYIVDGRSSKQENLESHGSNQSSTELVASGEITGRDGNEEVALHYVSFVGEGFTFYLQLGLGVFLLGSLVDCVINIVMIFLDGPKCFNFLYVTEYVLEFFYLLAQSIFIYTTDGVIFLKHRALVRIGLMHLFTTNLCVWIKRVIGDILEGMDIPEANLNATSEDNRTEYENETTCTNQMDIREKVLVFFNPAMIEYTFLTAAMILEVLTRVGCHREAYIYEMDNKAEKCKKFFEKDVFKGSRTGIVICTIILATTITLIIGMETFMSEEVAGILYTSLDIILNMTGHIVCVLLFLKFQSLSFRKKKTNSFDDKLLVTALFGVLIFGILLFTLGLHTNDNKGILNIVISNWSSLLSLTQVFFQTVVLLVGMRRESSTQNQCKSKPGKSLVAIMVGINLSQWLMNTFIIKNIVYVEESNIASSAIIAIQIVIHICLPMAILYRFQSSVCFALIWTTSYSDCNQNKPLVSSAENKLVTKKAILPCRNTDILMHI